MENAVSAVQNGATVITYAEVNLLDPCRSPAAVKGVEFEDKLEGGATRLALR